MDIDDFCSTCTFKLTEHLSPDISNLVVTYLRPTQSLVTLHGHSQVLLNETYNVAVKYSDTRCISFSDYILLADGSDYILLADKKYTVNDNVLFTHYHVDRYDQNVEIRLHNVIHNCEPEFEILKQYMMGMTNIGGVNFRKFWKK